MQELAPPDRTPPSYAVHDRSTAASGLSRMYYTRQMRMTANMRT